MNYNVPMQISPDEYIKTRLDDQINWYDKKSQGNQKYYKRLKIIEISLAVSLPLFVAYIDVSTAVKIIVSVMSVIIALVGAIIGIYRFKENWIEYRTTAEMLKHEKYLYLTQAVPYSGEDAFSILVQRVEKLISSENSKWLDYYKKLNKKGGQDG